MAAILLPVFAQAREKARTASCESNLKQLGLAFIMYNQDYDEMFPQQYGNNMPGFAGAGSWSEEIYPYVKSVGVFRGRN